MMRISIYLCSTPAALIQQEAALSPSDVVLYRTPAATAESGDIVRFLANPNKSPVTILDNFNDQYLLVVREP